MARRTPHAPLPALPAIGALDVRAIRLRAGLAQARFADCLNVSCELVQAWETGRRTPRGAALRLLAIAQSNPEMLFPPLDPSAPVRPLTPTLGSVSQPVLRSTPAVVEPPRVEQLVTEFDIMLCNLVDQGVRFVVVGGLAAQLRGAQGRTDDVDIVYDRSPANLERLTRFLRKESSTLRGAPGRLPFAADPRTLAHTAVLAIDTRLGPLDLRQRIAGVGDYAEVERRAAPVMIAGRQVPTLTLDALIDSRRSAGRPRDREQLSLLEELRRS